MNILQEIEALERGALRRAAAGITFFALLAGWAAPLRAQARPSLVLAVATLSLAGGKIAKGQVSWNGAVLEIDCAGTESVGGTVAKERRCMEVAASNKMLLGNRILCTKAGRDNGRCPDTIPEDRYFPELKYQDCTDRDIPADRGRCLYGRGQDTFAVASCAARTIPVSCCSGSGTGTCPALPTCDAAEWGHVSRDLETGLDSWCNGTSFVTVTDQQPGQWYPFVIEAAVRGDVSDLPACDSTIEGLAQIVEDGSGAADCSVGLSGNQHRCRCLSGTWTDEIGEYQVWPPSSSLFGVAAVGGLPPCNSDTNNLRAWVGPFADATRPWLDGTLYRCSDPTWAVNATNYRVSVNDDSWGDIPRPWCDGQGGNAPSNANCWVAPTPDSATSWVRDEARDAIERWFEFIFFRQRDDGQADINEQRVIPAESN